MLVYQRFTDLSVADYASSLDVQDINNQYLRTFLIWLRTRVSDNYTRQTVRQYCLPLSYVNDFPLFQWRHGAHVPYFYIGRNGPLMTCGLHGNIATSALALSVLLLILGKYDYAKWTLLFVLLWNIWIRGVIWFLMNTD